MTKFTTIEAGDERLEGLAVCIKAEGIIFHVPAAWLSPSFKFEPLYRAFLAKGEIEEDKEDTDGTEDDDWPMHLPGVKAGEFIAFLKVLDPRSEAHDWPFGFGNEELNGALMLAQRWGFQAIEKKCLRFSQELGLFLSRPTGKSAKRRRLAAKKANRKAERRNQKIEKDLQKQGLLCVRMVKRPRFPPAIAKTFNSGHSTTKSRVEYDLEMQGTFEEDAEKLQSFLEGKAKARKGKKRSKVTDADGYFSLPIELMRLLDERM